MPRRINNPERQDPREIVNKIIKEIKSFSDTGDELEELNKFHSPRDIFAMPEGPAKQERLGAYVVDLRKLLTDANYGRRIETKKRQIAKRKASAIEEAEARKEEKREKARAARARRKGKATSRRGKRSFSSEGKSSPLDVMVTYPGSYQGFRYEVYLLQNGKYAAKVTNKARKLLPFSADKAIEIGTRYLNVKKEIPIEGISRRDALEAGTAPVIQEQRFLKKLYREKEDAEVAARRAINTVLNWYDDRGARTKERMRKTKAARAAVTRRTAGQVKALAMTEAERAEKKAREKILKARKERKIEKRFKRQQEQRRPEGPIVEGKSRKRVFVPKPNPSAFDVFYNPSKDGKPGHTVRSAQKEFKKHVKLWKESLEDGSPDFEEFFNAYDYLEYARANAHVNGFKKAAASALAAKKKLRDQMIDILETMFHSRGDTDDYRVYQENPGPEVHQRVGNKKLESAERALSTYMRTGNATTLMNAYKNFELALEELKYVKDKDGIKRAKKGVKSARAEMSSMMGK